MEPFRIIVDRFVFELGPETFDKDEKHAMWHILEQRVRIDSTYRSVSDAIKIYTRSVFEAINDGDASQIKNYLIDAESDYIVDI